MPDEFRETGAGVGTVPVLRPMPLGDENEHSVLGHAPPAKPDQPLKNVRRERRRTRRVEA